MGRSLNEAKNLMWLYSHAERLAQQFGVMDFLNLVTPLNATHSAFAEGYYIKVEKELSSWSPEKLGKLIAQGVDIKHPDRTPFNLMKADQRDGQAEHHSGASLLDNVAVMVLLAAMYDVTVVRTGRERTRKGEHELNLDGVIWWHGPTMKVLGKGEQPNPYWRPEVLQLSNWEKQRLGRYFEKMEAEGHPPM
jgi:hypothetical protein